MPVEGVDAHFLEWHPLQQISFSGRNAFPLISMNLIPGQNSLLSKEALEKPAEVSIIMLLPTVFCFWLKVTANSGIPCTWIAEYRTIANRDVDAGGAVMFV